MSQPKSSAIDFGSALKDAIQNGINTTLSIGGFIIIFSVVISLIKNSSYIYAIFKQLGTQLNFSYEAVYYLFLGSVEITNGCSSISTLSIPIDIKLGIISFLCSFSGLAIIAQVSSFVSNTKANYPKYVLLKLIQGIISFFITYFLIKVIPSSIYASNIKINSQLNTYVYFCPLLIIILLTLLLSIIKKINFK